VFVQTVNGFVRLDYPVICGEEMKFIRSSSCSIFKNIERCAIAGENPDFCIHALFLQIISKLQSKTITLVRLSKANNML